MAKKIVLSINDGYVATFFPENRIKTKLQILIILMETVRYVLNSPVTQIIGKDIENKIILIPNEYLSNSISKIEFKKVSNKLEFLKIYFKNEDYIQIVQN